MKVKRVRLSWHLTFTCKTYIDDDDIISRINKAIQSELRHLTDTELVSKDYEFKQSIATYEEIESAK